MRQLLMYALWQVLNGEYSHHSHLRRRPSDTAAPLFMRLDPPGMLFWNVGARLAAGGSWDASSQCGTMKQLDPTQIHTATTK